MASGRFSSAYLVDFDDSSQAFVPAGSLKPPADAKQARCILQFKRIDSQPTAHDREGGGSLVRDVKSLTTSGQAADTCLVVVLAMLAYVGNRKEPFPAPLQSLRFVSPTKLEVTLVCGDDQRYDEVEAQFQGVFKSLTLLRGPQHRLPVKNNSLPTAQPAVNASQRVVSPVNGGAFHSGASHSATAQKAKKTKKCPDCSRKFADHTALKSHQAAIHFHCQTCGAAFETKSLMKKHHKSAHT